MTLSAFVRLVDRIPLSRNPAALKFAMAACVGVVAIRMGAAAIGDAPLPFTCNGPDGRQALVEDTEQGPEMKLISAKGSFDYHSLGLYRSSELVWIARKYCRERLPIPVAEEIGDGSRYYSCRGLRGQTATLELLNLEQTRMTTNRESTLRADRPFYVLRGDALRYCINGR